MSPDPATFPAELDYAPAPLPNSRLRKAAWHTLLSLGILVTILGLCFALSAFLPLLACRRSLHPHEWLPSASIVFLTLCIGIAQIRCSLRLANGSTLAIFVAFFLVALDFLGILVLAGATTHVMLLNPPDTATYIYLVIVFGLYSVVALALGTVFVLLLKILLAPHRPAPTATTALLPPKTRTQNTRLRRIAWITLFILGLITAPAGLIAIAIVIIGLACIGELVPMINATPMGEWLLLSAMFFIPFIIITLILGTAEIICARLIARQSRPAAKVALTLIALQLIVSISMAAWLTIYAFQTHNFDSRYAIYVTIYSTISAPLTLVGILLLKTLREPRQTMLSPKPRTLSTKD